MWYDVSELPYTARSIFLSTFLQFLLHLKLLYLALA
jgi:hypothetical protein